MTKTNRQLIQEAIDNVEKFQARQIEHPNHSAALALNRLQDTLDEIEELEAQIWALRNND